MRLCARCPKPVRSEGQRYCAEHHAQAQREFRIRRSLTLAGYVARLKRMAMAERAN